MGLFSSKVDKDQIKQLSMQTEKQQEIIAKLGDENEELRKRYELAEKSRHVENEKLLKEKEKLENNIRKLNELLYNSSKTCMQSVTINENEKGNLFECGIYKAGVDFPEGKYDFHAISGEGLLTCTRGDIWVNMSENPHDSYVKNYRNLDIPKGSRIEISGNLKLVMVKSLKIVPYENSDMQDGLLISGIYKVGTDIPCGSYVFETISGKGSIEVEDEIYEHMSKESEKGFVSRAHILLKNGRTIIINGDLKICAYKSAPILAYEKINSEEENIIFTGQYKIGEDIQEGKYIIELKSGKGCIYDEDEIFLTFDDESKIKRVKVILKKGRILFVEGDLEVYLYEAKPLQQSKGKKRDISDNSILCGGVYEAGVDIPYGYYDIFLFRGKGRLELETINENRLNFYEEFSENELREYRNLLVEFGDKITVECGLEISLTYSKPYINEDISKNILREIKDVKFELSLLSNNLIQEYYKFSDYSQISAEECKNTLMLLKQEEKEIRDSGDDIIITDSKASAKFTERLIRQILRTFNAECDNITLNVSFNNIDQSRKKIQQSFETLNKLYAVYGVQLSRTLLKLKLEQASLMYTYELKYQQEKDIQKAIKEQMLDEAKAQREIEEQKKKIEKDLQQHLGEINRLMKYLQKTQIDAEKQLYMDKIKELEEKIKVLESDKQTVLEREANAKAGFVYIISNIGSFGENIYKIGMTRRLEPMDRINELSSASVPFEFDVHAMIFSSDAPELENTLHKHFADKAVNKVNPRKEFYNVDIDEIEKIVKENYNDTVQFTKVPVAREYRQSLSFQGVEM